MRLAAHPSAVYGEDGSRDVIAGGGAEEESGSGEILGLAPTGSGDAFEYLAVSSLVRLEGFGVGGAEVAGCNGVDLNTFGCPLVGKGFGELGDASFAGGVSGDADASLEAEKRRDVDDLAVAARNHVASGELRELERASEVDLEDAVPVFESDFFGSSTVDGAGVVDEDIDAAQRSDGLMEEVFGSVDVREIRLEGVGFAACGVDGRGGVIGGAAVAMAGNRGSGLCQRNRDGSAEAAGGTCDEGYLVVEAEEIEGVRLGVCHARFNLRCEMR